MDPEKRKNYDEGVDVEVNDKNFDVQFILLLCKSLFSLFYLFFYFFIDFLFFIFLFFLFFYFFIFYLLYFSFHRTWTGRGVGAIRTGEAGTAPWGGTGE